MSRPEMLEKRIMLPYVIGHITGDPNDSTAIEYVMCTHSLQIKQVDVEPNGLTEPWGWYKILMSDGASWLDVTMINFDVDELYDDPFIHMEVGL